ncbi:hypothetical protein LCGC14_2522730, partial [marine sediment metagenome]
MAYADLDDVQGLIAKWPIGTTTTPTMTQATAIINDVSFEIDAALSANGIAVPVTTPAWFVSWLSLANQYGAAAAILKSMFPGATGPDETPAYAFWESRYQKALKGIKDGSLIPPGQANEATVAPSTYLTRNPDTEEDLGDIAE